MQTRLLIEPIEGVECGALVLIAFEGSADDRLGDIAKQLYASGEAKGKEFEMILLHQPSGVKASRVLLVGAGKREKLSPSTLRRAVGAAVRFLKSRFLVNIGCALDDGFASADYVAAAVEGAIAGDFDPDRYKTDKSEDCAKPVERFTVIVPGGSAELEQALRRGEVVAGAQNFTRDLVNEPGNRMTPSVLAQRARQMASENGLECEVLDQDRMRQLGMGALLGVAQGSAEPPALIVVRYRPTGERTSGPHLGLVGKGITFDSGGISIKPSEGMDRMKSDMAGGAAVLGAMLAIAQLKPAVAVTALVPAVENMPGGKAQRPGDIVTTMSGKTVEVLNTDAEGRLILADALTYGQQLGCTHLIDVATLTGAIVVALGHTNVGVFSNDETLAGKLLDAASAAGEKMWRMPLDDEYKEQLKTPFADIPNIGTRWGGAITAAMFLKEFAGSLPWVHLDIAGTAWLEDTKPFLAKGPTGVAVRTFVRLVTDWKD